MGSTFNALTIPLIFIAIVLNLVLGQLAAALNLPPYLDNVGTVLAGVLAGPLAGGLTGLLSGVIGGLLTNTNPIYLALVAAVVGILAGLIGARSWFRRWVRVLLGGLLTGLAAALVGALALTATSGAFAPATFVTNLTNSLLGTLGAGGVASELLEMVVSFLLSFGIVRSMARRLLIRFPQGERSAAPHRRPLIGRVD